MKSRKERQYSEVRFLKDHSLYLTWWGIKSRCNNPNSTSYVWYGGRGIRLWDPWDRDFWAFVFYMGGDKPSPYHSVDRIDVNGDYEPGNVRWATSKEQNSNKVKKTKPNSQLRPKTMKVKKPLKPKKEAPVPTDPDERGFALVLTKLTRAEIARGLEIKKQNLTRWKRVPPHHVAKVSELSGLSKAEILPSMFA